MRITELLHKNAIDLHASVASKKEAIEHLVDLMEKTGAVADKQVYTQAVLAREKEGSTGIGEGIAIPHAKTTAVKKAALSAMVVPGGVDFDALDAQPAKLFFLIAAPDTDENVHLDVLGQLSILLMDDAFRQALMQAKSNDEFCSVIDRAQAQKENDAGAAPAPAEGYYDILAVTACPTGIAHTYMAAEGLQAKAEALGLRIKVETDGSGGVKDALTGEEIAHARGIIIAADKNVAMDRFDGKLVLKTKVADGIHKPGELIEQVLQGNAPVYHAQNAASHVHDPGKKEGIGHQIYKHLMNGVSHMLPFVIGGGILIALAFLFDSYEIDPSNFGKNTPFAAFLKTVGDTAFGFMLPVLAGFIAMSIGDRPALAVGFVGGMLASTGGAGFLGALLAGFIAGYLVVGMRRLFDYLPKSLEGIKPVLLYPLLGVLAIGAIMWFVVNPPVSYLNELITQGLNSMGEASKAVLGLVLGGMMAIDMGGPINKAAYVFGTAAIAAGNFDIMAAVMIGGMVPPLAIALCATFFKSRFTKKERQSALVNYVMGFSFITEGAIPFAAADPLRVIPSVAVGAGVAGCLSMIFGCTLRAPHGGIFVTPVIGNAWMYLLALAIGSVVGMILLALLKKPVKEEAH